MHGHFKSAMSRCQGPQCLSQSDILLFLISYATFLTTRMHVTQWDSPFFHWSCQKTLPCWSLLRKQEGSTPGSWPWNRVMLVSITERRNPNKPFWPMAPCMSYLEPQDSPDAVYSPWASGTSCTPLKCTIVGRQLSWGVCQYGAVRRQCFSNNSFARPCRAPIGLSCMK